MHLIFAVLILGLVVGGAVAFGGHVTGRVASSGPPGPARAARGVQRGGRQVVDRSREVWAEAKSTDWLERRRIARERKAARPPAGQRAAAAAGATGRGTAAVARWATAPLRRPDETGAAPPAAEPAPAPAPAPVPAPGPRRVPSPTGTPPPPASQPASAPSGRTDPVTTPGASADLFVAVQQLTAQANAGGLRAKQRAITTLAEALDYIQTHLTVWAAHLAENNHYPAVIWEPLTTCAAHVKAASGSAGESSSAILAMSSMTVGELAVSPVRAPHEDELNKDAA